MFLLLTDRMHPYLNSVKAPTANEAREPSNPLGPSENQRESKGRPQENGQNPVQIRTGTKNPETAATPRTSHSSENKEQNQQPKKELTEAQKEDIRKKKKELDELMAKVDDTEKMIMKAFPFQEAIVVGNFLATFPNTTKIIRIFTSSTFTGGYKIFTECIFIIWFISLLIYFSLCLPLIH